MEKAQNSKGKLSGRHVLLMFLGFFGIIFVVNGIFLSKAISSFPGEITKKSYVQGLKYNSVLDQKEAQQQLGWNVGIGVIDNKLVTQVVDKNGQPMPSMKVTAELIQHSDDHLVKTIDLYPESKTEYSHTLENMSAGRWTVNLKVSSNTGDTFLASKEIKIQ